MTDTSVSYNKLEKKSFRETTERRREKNHKISKIVRPQ